MHKPARAVIFDLDGTLANTIDDIALSINGALSKRGFPTHDIPTIKLMVGNGFRNLVVAALPREKQEEALIEEIRAEATAYYAAHPLDRTRPYPGIMEMLSGLASLGIPRAVLSNKPDGLTQAVVNGLFPQAGFSVVRGETAAFPRKPEPASVLDIAKTLGMEPGEILYVGDTNVDMHTAHNSGMRPIGAAWGFRSIQELVESGAEVVITHPSELLRLF
jgi:phosphoglycolate phosphatase